MDTRKQAGRIVYGLAIIAAILGAVSVLMGAVSGIVWLGYNYGFLGALPIIVPIILLFAWYIGYTRPNK